MTIISRWFVAKSRKVTFKVHIELLELINIPLVSGIFYAKWKLKNGVSASGCTSRAPISEHRVEWDHIISKQMELVVGKDGVLSPCELHLAIKQVMNQEKPRNLGVLVLNLAEYAKEGEVTRRYLLQESKSNSTLKITIRMDQIEGDVPFKTPCLKKPQLPTTLADLSPSCESTKLNSKNRSIYDNIHYPSDPLGPIKNPSNSYLPLAADGTLIDPNEEPTLDIMNEIFFPSSNHAHAPSPSPTVI